jgi:hypothetical protein
MEYPRVTEVLRPFTSYDSVPPNILKRAAARGTSVHAICAGIAKGAWIPDSMIPEELAGYVTSFKLWAEAQVKSFEIVEKRYIDEELIYTGQLDFVVKGTDDELYLVDLKTSARPQKTYPVQMAAYDCLLRKDGTRVKAAMIVYLKKDGEFPDIDLIEDLTEELDVFVYALHCWKFFNRRKLNATNLSTTKESAPADSGDDE